MSMITFQCSESDRRNHLRSMLICYEKQIHQSSPKHNSFDLKEEQDILGVFDTFIKNHENCFDRACLPGHVTGSALVTNTSMDQVLLTHHRKLNLWLQLGGHSDGNPLTDQVAYREAQEESGITALKLWTSDHRVVPFDLDWHKIPEHKGTPAHIHYDVRFLLVASQEERIIVSDESHDVRWFSLADAFRANSERSMHRQFDKLRLISSHS